MPATTPTSVGAPSGTDRRAVTAAAVAVVCWSSAFVAIRKLGRSFDPGGPALGRLLVAANVAQLIEALAGAVGRPERPTSAAHRPRRRQARRRAHVLRPPRGALGVALFDALAGAGLIVAEDGLTLISAGRAWFADLAGEDALRVHRSRPLLRTCLDWTERRPHLGGALGAALCSELECRGWITRGEDHRAVAVTAAGAQGLRELLGLEVPAAER